MPQISSYLKPDLPRDFAIQVASYVRMQWPQVFRGEPPLWESTPYANDCRHFVVTDGDVLISHAIAVSRKLEHSGQTFNVYGLSSVFCYPSHRGRGFGEQVAAAATDYCRTQPGADFALLFCGERVHTMYLRLGWQHTDEITVHYGDVNQPKRYGDGWLMGLFLSQRARDARHPRRHADRA